MNIIVDRTRQPDVTGPQSPFSLPADLPAEIARAHEYWQRRRRGENAMPFSDDVSLSELPDLSAGLFLLDVFATPPRVASAWSAG
jgi:hypothetical protein